MRKLISIIFGSRNLILHGKKSKDPEFARSALFAKIVDTMLEEEKKEGKR